MTGNGSYTTDLTAFESYFLASVNVFFSLCGILGNVLVIVVIARSRQLHTVSNTFITSLAAADLLVCVVSQPMNAVFLYGLPPNTTYGNTRKMFSFVSVLASISNLAAVTIDRYVAIVNPMQYQLRANFKSASLLLCAIWVVSLALGIPSGFVRSIQHITVYYVIALLFVIIPIYVRIYSIARNQRRLIARQGEHIKRDLKNKTRKENIAAKTIGFVIVVFIICWLPLLITPMIFRHSENSRIVRKSLKWVQNLALCSSALNPVIYSLKTQIFRKELRKVFRRALKRHSRADQQITYV